MWYSKTYKFTIVHALVRIYIHIMVTSIYDTIIPLATRLPSNTVSVTPVSMVSVTPPPSFFSSTSVIYGKSELFYYSNNDHMHHTCFTFQTLVTATIKCRLVSYFPLLNAIIIK